MTDQPAGEAPRPTSPDNDPRTDVRADPRTDVRADPRTDVRADPRTDVRRLIPRTDELLASPALAEALRSHGREAVKQAVVTAQQQARSGAIHPDEVASAALRALRPTSSLVAVLNATGVVVHTNIGRAPLSRTAVEAVVAASQACDLELDLDSGRRSPGRGAGALEALLEAVPEAQAALVVNNGAAALLLATTVLAGPASGHEEVVVSRGELVEIGAGFRLPDLIASTGVRLREVGTTNRTHAADYRAAVTATTGCLLKVHPSNFRVEGFTSAVGLDELVALGREADLPVVTDIGSGLLRPDRSLPDEPSAADALAAGADLVTFSGDKLLGGPQAGIVLGRADLVERLRRHPLARALRVDKLTLAALEATLRGPLPPVTLARRQDADSLRGRTTALAEACGGRVVDADGRIGGGGAPGHLLPGLAVALPGPADELARTLRTSRPAVLARVEDGSCLVDLRCIDPADDATLTAAVLAAVTAAQPSTADRGRR